MQRAHPIYTAPGTSTSFPTTGSCDCGSVRVELLTPLQELEVKEDNCSICARVSLFRCPLYKPCFTIILMYQICSRSQNNCGTFDKKFHFLANNETLDLILSERLTFIGRSLETKYAIWRKMANCLYPLRMFSEGCWPVLS